MSQWAPWLCREVLVIAKPRLREAIGIVHGLSRGSEEVQPKPGLRLPATTVWSYGSGCPVLDMEIVTVMQGGNQA